MYSKVCIYSMEIKHAHFIAPLRLPCCFGACRPPHHHDRRSIFRSPHPQQQQRPKPIVDGSIAPAFISFGELTTERSWLLLYVETTTTPPVGRRWGERSSSEWAISVRSPDDSDTCDLGEEQPATESGAHPPASAAIAPTHPHDACLAFDRFHAWIRPNPRLGIARRHCGIQAVLAHLLVGSILRSFDDHSTARSLPCFAPRRRTAPVDRPDLDDRTHPRNRISPAAALAMRGRRVGVLFLRDPH